MQVDIESGLIPSYAPLKIKEMRVPSIARRSVVFLGTVNAQHVFRARATGFLVHTYMENESDFSFPYLVTAQHVVSGLLQKGDIFCRMNMKDGSISVVKLDSDGWYYHPDDMQTDVAIRQFVIEPSAVDHDYIPLLPPDHWSGNRKPPFGLGDELFVLGLFKNHHGLQKNVPIVRVGNIAAMPEEPVKTNYCGFMDAYLIELRSIAGLSGSPVFVNVPPLSSDSADHPSHMRPQRQSNSSFILSPGLIGPSIHPVEPMQVSMFMRNPEQLNWLRYQFLGLIHGHFDAKDLIEDAEMDLGAVSNPINTGIGIVVPASKILETVYQPYLVAHRKKIQKEIRDHAGTTAD